MFGIFKKQIPKAEREGQPATRGTEVPDYLHSEMKSVAIWSKTRSELIDLPGIQPESDGSIDFSISDDEAQEVSSFFRLLEDYSFHPEIAESIPRLVTAFALCRYSIQLACSLPDPETPEEYQLKSQEITATLMLILAALYKALSIYPTPLFTYHLIHANKLAGRSSEVERLREVKSQQDAKWKPTQLDDLFKTWLESSLPSVVCRK